MANNETPGETYDAESWEYARGYAQVLGTVPSSFTSVIRSLILESSSGLSSTAGNSRYFVLRLFKSRSLLSPFEHARKVLDPDHVVQANENVVDLVLKTFAPFELGVMLGLVYLSRRARSICDVEESKYLFDPLCMNSVAGLAIGRTIPVIGGATGLIEGTYRLLALTTFLKHDIKGFREYRREIKKSGNSWNATFEMQRWGCNSIQIASVFLQTLGFGVDRANGFVNALSSKAEVGTTEELSFARDLRMSMMWREALLNGQLSPSVGLPPRYYPTKGSLDIALKVIKNIRENPLEARWLERGKDDLPDNSSAVSQPKPDATAAAEQLADEALEALEALDEDA